MTSPVPPPLVPSARRSILSRRNALRLGLLAVPGAALWGSPLPAVAAPTRASGPEYVRYEDLVQPGDDLQAVVNRVTGDRILTLPAGNFEVQDFRNGYYDGIRIGTGSASGCRGLSGSGALTVISVAAGSATRDRGDRFAGNQLTIANTPGAVLENFCVRGFYQGGLIFSGITVENCPDAQLSWLYLRGASRGYANYPPGETFSINILGSARTLITDCEVDGRNAYGDPVIASPIGFNNTRDARVVRTYCHHGRAGMLTFYKTTNVTTEDYRCFATSSGPGALSGHGLNHEQCDGVIRHYRPSLFINGRYSRAAGASTSTGMHVMLANTSTDVPDVQVIEPTFDPGPGSTGMFSVEISDGYSVGGALNKIRTPPRIVLDGVVLQRSDHPIQGWGDKDPARYFSWIH